MARSKKKPTKKTVATHKHAASRANIPTAELDAVASQTVDPLTVTLLRADDAHLDAEIEGRDRDLDPQLMWRGKDRSNSFDVPAPPLYIQEKVHPKALVDALRRETEARRAAEKVKESGGKGVVGEQADLFADFNGLPRDADARTEFYEHQQNWTNRLILGDALQVMASLSEREGLKGKVQCIYMDPPYGIKFNSNFQWSTASRDVKDGNRQHITREPEQVKAFRDTWKDGIHSYLTYLRDRLVAARELLHESGSIFVQIGDENVHRVRAVMDEVFGDGNRIAQILFKKTGGLTSNFLSSVGDYVLWYGIEKTRTKYRQLYSQKVPGESGATQFKYELQDDGSLANISFEQASKLDPSRVVYHDNITSQGNVPYKYAFRGRSFKKGFKPSPENMPKIDRAGRLIALGNTPRYIRKLSDFGVYAINELWEDLSISGFADPKVYVVQTATSAIQRCLLMASDPGDLVLDPTCGSGTTATVAEQWGRRWITIDTSRVALTLARARIMGARYPYYLLSDSHDGRTKEAAIQGVDVESIGGGDDVTPTGDLRQGFVYDRVPHVTLKSIANNKEIDELWEAAQPELEDLRELLNTTLKQTWEEWEIPREAEDKWPAPAKKTHAAWWKARIARQKAIDASIARKAEQEFLYDKPYEDNSKVRVAGPFTVESLSPHRVIGVDEDGQPLDPLEAVRGQAGGERADFAAMVLTQLRTAGVQQADKQRKLDFDDITERPGRWVAAEGTYTEDDGSDRRAGILIGPEFGTLQRRDLLDAAREAKGAGFDVLVACGFAFDPHTDALDPAVPVLKARMNADLHMAADLEETDKANLFVIFGEPDVAVLPPEDAPDDAPIAGFSHIRVELRGLDTYNPATGKVEVEDAENLACWFIDSDYDGQSFFVRQAYFIGANDPYKQLRRTLQAEIDEEAWETIQGTVSREFAKPEGGRIAVKVVNHLGDEVVRVIRVD